MTVKVFVFPPITEFEMNTKGKQKSLTMSSEYAKLPRGISKLEVVLGFYIPKNSVRGRFIREIADGEQYSMRGIRRVYWAKTLGENYIYKLVRGKFRVAGNGNDHNYIIYIDIKQKLNTNLGTGGDHVQLISNTVKFP